MNLLCRGRRVLVTGGLGFIGLNLVKALLDGGAIVEIVNRSLPPLALRWLKRIAKGRPIEVYQGNICDPELMRQRLPKAEVVFNLAAQSGASRSLAEARMDMQVNIASHLNLLETIRQQTQCPRIVFISSRLVYGVTGSQPVNEDHLPCPTSLYGLHKLTGEYYYKLYNSHYSIPYAIARLTNPYGPYQLPHRKHYGIINRFIMAALRGETLTIYGDGQQLRDYIYVGDVVSALLYIGFSENGVGRTLNVGYGRSITLEATVRLILRLAGSGRVKMVPWPELDRKVETGSFVCDISRIQEVLHWEPEVDLEIGLEQTIRLYRDLLA